MIEAECRGFGQESGVIRGLWEDLCCISYDFQNALVPCFRTSSTVRGFSDFIPDFSSGEGPLLGVLFKMCFSYLMYIILWLFSYWEGYFPNGSSIILSRLVSDPHNASGEGRSWCGHLLMRLSSLRFKSYGRSVACVLDIGKAYDCIN